MAAIRMLEDEAKSGRTDPAVHPWALLWAGEQRRLSENAAQARDWFGQLAHRYPTHPLKDPAILGMALVDAETSLSGNTLATLQLMGDRHVPDSMNADRYRLLARVAADDGSPRAKVSTLVDQALRYGASDEIVMARVQASLSDLIVHKKQPTPENIDTAEAVPTGTPEQIALKRARAALASGDFELAKTQASGAIETWPASVNLAEFKYIVRRAEAQNPTTAGRVGVLLPLSGDYAPAALQLKQVIEKANTDAGGPIELVFGDTLGTLEGATAEVERLVIKEGCVALLGPLLKASGTEAATHAQALRTPMVTLTQGGDPTAAGDFVFRGFMTLQHQIDALLEHAFQREKHQRYAVLHPMNGYGESARDIFTEAVTARGGTVSKILGYETETTDFRKYAQEFGGKLLESRKDELWKMKREAKKRDENEDKVMLSPNIDYDAIFIPDNHRRLVLITSALAYEEFPVGSFRKLVEEEPLQLLGLNSWNNDQLHANGGRYVEDSAFVDAFWVADGNPNVQKFVEGFQADFKRDPRIIEALAWDATRLLTSAVLEGGDDREAIQAAMSQVEIDDPVAGGRRFNEHREVDRIFHVLTIKRDGIEQWTPPPPPFEDDVPTSQ
jgi:ABC-type branched-subunit amino acid transport system substrate-binding protein